MQSSYQLTGKFSEDCKSIDINHANMFSRIFQNWKDKELHLIISLLEEDKSNQQNRYFHGVIVQIIKDFLKETTGLNYDTEQTKLFIYRELLGYEFEEFELAGKIYYRLNRRTIRDWTTKEFNENKEIIQMKMAELDIIIPDPDPKYYTKL